VGEEERGAGRGDLTEAPRGLERSRRKFKLVRHRSGMAPTLIRIGRTMLYALAIQAVPQRQIEVIESSTRLREIRDLEWM
jgi:hypothetical protein